MDSMNLLTAFACAVATIGFSCFMMKWGYTWLGKAGDWLTDKEHPKRVLIVLVLSGLVTLTAFFYVVLD